MNGFQVGNVYNVLSVKLFSPKKVIVLNPWNKSLPPIIQTKVLMILSPLQTTLPFVKVSILKDKAAFRARFTTDKRVQSSPTRTYAYGWTVLVPCEDLTLKKRMKAIFENLKMNYFIVRSKLSRVTCLEESSMFPYLWKI